MLEGFLGDSVYKQTDENGKLVIITIAEWKDENCLNNAREAVEN